MKPKTHDEYIENAKEFAQPILRYLREVVHDACPEVKEEIKWSFPNFTYKGSILCNMAAFKEHVTFGFWLGALMDDPDGILTKTGDTSMGHFGRIVSKKDLPDRKILVKYIRHAMQLTDEGKKLPVKKAAARKSITVPSELQNALEKSPKALTTFEEFSYSNKKEYIEWIDDAKRESTKQSRIDQAIEWMEEGKPRNWKYMKK